MESLSTKYLLEQYLGGYSLEQDLGKSTIGDNNNNKNDRTNETITTFQFPISEIRGEAPMKNIPLSSLPYFQGLTRDDSNTFFV